MARIARIALARESRSIFGRDTPAVDALSTTVWRPTVVYCSCLCTGPKKDATFQINKCSSNHAICDSLCARLFNVWSISTWLTGAITRKWNISQWITHRKSFVEMSTDIQTGMTFIDDDVRTLPPSLSLNSYMEMRETDYRDQIEGKFSGIIKKKELDNIK